MGLKEINEAGSGVYYLLAVDRLRFMDHDGTDTRSTAEYMFHAMRARPLSRTELEEREINRHLDTPTEFGKLWHAEAVKLRLTR